MAEFLIYDRDYEEAYFKLDIIEERPDGYFCEPEETTGHGWNHDAFLLLKIPGRAVSGYLTESIPTRKRRYSITAQQSIIDQWRIDRVLEVSNSVFNESNIVDHS